MQRGVTGKALPRAWSIALQAGVGLAALLLLVALTMPSMQRGHGVLRRAAPPPHYNVSMYTSHLTAVLREAGVAQRITSNDDPMYAGFPELYRPRHHNVPGCRVVLSPESLDSAVVVADPPPFGTTNSLLSVELMSDPELVPYYEAVGLPMAGTKGVLHRKYYELAHVIRTLDKLGKLQPDATGLAIAAGREPVHYHLSTRIAKIFASDIYGDGSFAADGTAQSGILQDPAKFVKPGVTWNPERLQMMWQNARNLSSFKNASVDFTYSLSSIEHFGDEPTVGAGPAESVREQARVLKRGGIMFMAVDTIITGQDQLPGNGYTPAQLQTAIFGPAKASGMHLVEPVYWGISPLSIAAAEYAGVLGGEWKDECVSSMPHVVFCQSVTHFEWWKQSSEAQRQRPLRCITTLTLAFRKEEAV